MKTCCGGSVLFVASWLALAVPSSRTLNAQTLEPEFQVNTYTTDMQKSAKVAADGQGGFVVVWESVTQDGSDYGIFGQRFSAAGTPTGSEFQVNNYTTGKQYLATVAADGPGNFIVAWNSPHDGSSEGVFAQIYDATGAPFGSNFQLNTYTTGAQFFPILATNAAGDAVVLWTSDGQDGSSDAVIGRYAPAAQVYGPEFQVNTFTTGFQNRPAVAVAGTGEFVVVWGSQNQDGGAGYGVIGRLYDSLGAPLGGEFGVNSYTTDHQQRPQVAIDGAGNFVVVWTSRNQDGSSWGIFGQRFSEGGKAAGSEFQVNSFTTGLQYAPAVAVDAAGGFLVTWMSAVQDGSDRGIFGQRYDAAGTRVAGEFRVNSYTTNRQYAAAVTRDAADNFIVAWDSDGQDGALQGVYAKRYRALLFGGSFEPGDACDWSATLGGGCP